MLCGAALLTVWGGVLCGMVGCGQPNVARGVVLVWYTKVLYC